MSTYKLVSTKGTRVIDGSLADAIAAARHMQAELQPAYGVSVEDADGETVADIRLDDDERQQIVALIEELGVECPQDVADRAIEIAEAEGVEAGLAEVRRAKAYDEAR